MANQSVLELAVGTGKWDAGLKKAKQSLDNFTQANGGLQQALEKESQNMQKFVRMMGQMDSTAKTAKGQMNDYKSTIEQLTMQYNRMTDAQKQSIGQEYLNAIDQMKQKYQSVNEVIQEMNRSLNQATAPDTNSGGDGLFGGGKLGGMLQVFGGNLMTNAADAAMSFAGGIAECAKQGVELAKQGEGVYLAFQRLNQPGLLDNLRQATHGTVTNLELMKAAVKFNDFKLPLEELGTMLAFAQQKAKDTGQSVDYMVDSIVTGLGRKSLMILDNLGLSAAEIKERMAETGDMTKAVGEIIRDQMQNAGDYVETAADRATSANVELTNAMTELGNTLLPLQEAGESVFTGIQIAALQLLNDGVKPMVPVLVDIRNAVSDISKVSGTAKSTVIPLFQGITGAAAESLPVVGKLAMLINIIRGFSGGSGSGDMGASVGALGLPDATINEIPEIQVFGNKPKKKPRGGGAGGGGDEEVTFDISKIAFNPGEGEKFDPDRNWVSGFALMTEEAKKQMLGLNDAVEDLGDSLAKIGEKAVLQEVNDAIAKQKEAVEKTKKAWSDTGQAIGMVGNMMGSIKNPAAQTAGAVAQAIANIALAYSQALGEDGTIKSNIWYFIAATAAAMVSMATTISQIHSATGYAQGGIVEGNSYSGDNMMFGGDGLYGLNSGELVLTKAQQGNLASQLSGGAQNLQLDGVISGEKIHIVHNRYLKRTGQGELLTWG